MADRAKVTKKSPNHRFERSWVPKIVQKHPRYRWIKLELYVLYIYTFICSHVSLTILPWCNITHNTHCKILSVYENVLVLFRHVVGSRPLEVQTNQISQPRNSFPDIDGVWVYCCIGVWVYLDSSILIKSNATLDITRHHNKAQKKEHQHRQLKG